jgi:hypothetical protein
MRQRDAREREDAAAFKMGNKLLGFIRWNRSRMSSSRNVSFPFIGSLITPAVELIPRVEAMPSPSVAAGRGGDKSRSF